MSDTRRWIQPGWDGLPHMNLKSKKHQARDRPPTNRFFKLHRFMHGQRNSLYNLLRKIDELRGREATER